jgi:signal recognition particle subunit SRP54
MAQRILGMGDIVSLVEKAQEQYDAEKAADLQRKIRKNQFDFEDFLSQLKQIRKMGNMKDLLGMIPGIGKQIKDMDIDENQFTRIEAIILSMTPHERNNPDVLTGTRRQRIAAGSGSNIQEVNQFVKQFEEMRKMMKVMNKMGGGANAARALNGMMGKR